MRAATTSPTPCWRFSTPTRRRRLLGWRASLDARRAPRRNLSSRWQRRLVLVAVALPVPLFRTFTYEVSDEDAPRARPGMRAVVRVRNRSEIGVILGPGVLPPGVAAKPVTALPDSEPVVAEPLLEVCRWMSSYYAAPLGIAVRTALPALLLAE